MERGKRREVEFYMTDLLTIISRLQQEKRYKHIEPDHIEFASLMNEVSKEVRKELNTLYQEGKIGTCETINGKAVYVKGG